MTKIAILGWGSLIWDLENLTPHTTGDWLMEHGPQLPMEFSRISPKRKMGLVVCLDPTHGVPCKTHVIQSSKSTIEEAIANLAARERAPLSLIGAVSGDMKTGRMPTVCDAVSYWCLANNWDGAVWTDLEPNFKTHSGQDFSLTAGLAYLKTLSGESLDEAYRYIQSAPSQTDTPMRSALESNSWWQGLA